MTAFMLDEMFPAAAAALLRDRGGHDARHVTELGLGASSDADIAAFARSEGRALVTENAGDFAHERDVAVVFVLERHLPAGDGQAPALAALLDRWGRAHPVPSLGAHRPHEPGGWP